MVDTDVLRARHRQVDSWGRPHRYGRFCESEEEHRPTTVLWPCDAILLLDRLDALEKAAREAVDWLESGRTDQAEGDAATASRLRAGSD